jgi:regulator of protease activity HflC (stomatin/prohibitin superfamily)
VEIPENMQRAIARQAEAERERRAKVINAEGEFQASAKLADAADVMARNPTTLQLRYLQTLVEIGDASKSSVVIPLPVDLLRSVLPRPGGGGADRTDDLAGEPDGRLEAGRAGGVDISSRR